MDLGPVPRVRSITVVATFPITCLPTNYQPAPIPTHSYTIAPSYDKCLHIVGACLLQQVGTGGPLYLVEVPGVLIFPPSFCHLATKLRTG